MGKTLITFMIVLCFLTTSMGIGNTVSFFDVGNEVLTPCVRVINGVSDFIYDSMSLGIRRVPEGEFYFQRWYFGDTNEHYVDFYYKFRLGVPLVYAINSDVKIKNFSNDGYRNLFVTTDVGFFVGSAKLLYKKHRINGNIYHTYFRDIDMTLEEYNTLIEQVKLE